METPTNKYGTYCGLNHQRSYQRNTGKLPTASQIRRATQSCESWNRELVKVQAGTPGLADHASVGRMWDAHLADLGVSS